MRAARIVSIVARTALLFAWTTIIAPAQTLQVLHFFRDTDGAYPIGELMLGNDGNFYGTTYSGGGGYGTVFQVTSNGALSSLYTFPVDGTVGRSPLAGLTLGNDGSFYGTTSVFGSGGHGTIFQVTTNGVLTTLVSLANTNGSHPAALLTLGDDGNFYGTTSQGGVGGWSGYGTIFLLTTNGAFTTLVSFNGRSPSSALTPGNDGNFYGATSGGGGDYGTIYRVATNGALTTIYSFTARTNGAYPKAALTKGRDGNFYGTTTYGGASDYGTVFKVTTNGTLTTLVSFNGTNGANPEAALAVGGDDNLYGTTTSGGDSNYGTVFVATTNGTLATLVSFADTNGSRPTAGLTLGSDGNFYGTTRGGGNNGRGTIFRLLLPPVIILVPPQSQTNNAGATVTFLVGATSSLPMSFQWQKNGTNLFDGGNILGSTTNTLQIIGISSSDAAVYSVVVSNANGSVTNYATLTVIDPPIITTQPTNLLVLLGSEASFGVSATGTARIHYQWRFNGINLLNATNSSYAVPSVTTNQAGSYSVVATNAAGVVTSSNAALTVVVSPKNQTNYASSTANFTVSAFSPVSLNYQWQKNGTNLVNGSNISGVRSSTLTIVSISDADAATYNAVVSDASGSVSTANAVLAVNNSLIIAAQPQSQTVLAGGIVTFNVTVYGAPPFVFQWYFKGTPLGSPTAGTNFSSYTLTNVGTNQAGNYNVRVVNGYGSVTSSQALLTVVIPPSLALEFLAGYPLLSLHGMLGKNFVVQCNTNLTETTWFNLLSLTNLSVSPYQFLDPAGIAQRERFYRAFMH